MAYPKDKNTKMKPYPVEYGYPQIAGTVIEKVMTTIPWLTNKN